LKIGLEYISYKPDGMTEEGSLKIEQYFKNKIPDYKNIYEIIKTDLIDLKREMNSPYLEDNEFERLMKQFNDKEKDMKDYKNNLLKDLESFIPQAEELIRKYHSDEEKIYLEELYKKAKDAKEELENLENNISRPQKSIPYIQ
ncbi:MAG: hypothetical protein KAJ54_01430, partial [Candidatus Aenigmarchaeota archaeon]|nr:hypothetical protein [Candidatus Aenigmarchaeota archaeon]